MTSKTILSFNKAYGKALICQGKGRNHARNPATNNKGPLCNRHVVVWKGFITPHLGNCHAHQVLGLSGCSVWPLLMYPGVLIPDVCHLKKKLVYACLPQGLLEKGLVGPWGAGGHHNPVEPLFLNGLHHLVDGVLGTGKEVILGKDNPGQGPCVLGNLFNIHHACYVYPA